MVRFTYAQGETEKILRSEVVIDAVTIFFTILDICFGIDEGGRFRSKLVKMGGVIHIGIGLKILIEHLWQPIFLIVLNSIFKRFQSP